MALLGTGAAVGCGLALTGSEATTSTVDAGADRSAPVLPPRGDGNIEPLEASVPDAASAEVVFEHPDGGVIRAVAVVGGKLYWLDRTTNEIFRAELDGSAPTVVVTGVTGQQFAIVGTDAWFVLAGDDLNLFRRALDAGTETAFPVGKLHGCISVDQLGTTMYGADYTDSRIVSVPVSGGSVQPTVVLDAASVTSPWGVAVDSTALYYTDGRDRVVRRDDGGPVVVAANQASPQCLTLDGAGYVYWPSYGDGGPATGGIHRVFVDGGVPETLATGQGEPTTVGIDAEYIYWNSGSKVLRLRRQ